MEHKVLDLQVGIYECDTLFVEKDKIEYQVPVFKTAKPSPELIGKTIKIDNLGRVPLDKVVLVNFK